MKDHIENILKRNISFEKPEGMLQEQLDSGKKLRVKFGIDPTGSRIHMGRAATLMKLRDFQLAGHNIVLIIGDFTALVGDASDKKSERPMLLKEDIAENLKNYLAEIGRIIDIEKCEVRYNSEWLGKLDFNDIGQLADNFSVAEMLDRDNFSKRYKAGKRISLREFLYPLMQGYDSVIIKSDVELGGNDQLFNLLAGRTLQKSFGQKPQSVIGTNLINAANGEKMSTSLGNCIYIDEPANEMFGALMALRDDEMESYFEVLTRVDMDEAKKMITSDPRSAKAWLAREIVSFFHDAESAKQAEQVFNNIFRDGGKPTDMVEIKGLFSDDPVSKNIHPDVISLHPNVLLTLQKATGESKSQIKRLFREGAIKVNGRKRDNEHFVLNRNDEIQIGKKRWYRII